VVQRKVNDIESEGLEEVGKIYAEFKEHPELRIFLDQLRAFEKIYSTRAEIFMDSGFPPANLLDPKKRMSTEVPQLPPPAQGNADTADSPAVPDANEEENETATASTRDAD
jgi:hypothetical protein